MHFFMTTEETRAHQHHVKRGVETFASVVLRALGSSPHLTSERRRSQTKQVRKAYAWHAFCSCTCRWNEWFTSKNGVWKHNWIIDLGLRWTHMCVVMRKEDLEVRSSTLIMPQPRILHVIKTGYLRDDKTCQSTHTPHHKQQLWGEN